MNPAGAMMTAARTCVRALADLVLPEVCAACTSRAPAADNLCSDCGKALLEMVALPYCPRCGATIGPHIPIREDGCFACPTVLPRFSQVVRLGPYAAPLRDMIHELKYRMRQSMLRRVGRLLAQALATRCGQDLPDLAMPVPMHWRRRIWQGYNHAELLAGAVAVELDLPVGDELVRVRNTPPQTSLSRTRRIENLRGAFGVTSKANLEGTTVLLVDDVTTTGATANEATRTLLGAGASRVILAVIAKTEPPTAYSRDWLEQEQPHSERAESGDESVTSC